MASLASVRVVLSRSVAFSIPSWCSTTYRFLQRDPWRAVYLASVATYALLKWSQKGNKFNVALEDVPEVKGSPPPEEQHVLEAARYFMENAYYKVRPDLLAEDFVFRGIVIGPLNKADYLTIVGGTNPHKAMPDFSANAFGYVIDPRNPYRVWFFARVRGTIQGNFGGTLGWMASLFLSPTPEKPIEYQGSTEALSLTFDRDLKVRYFTFGYVVDRFDPKATTSFGGTYGMVASLGIPLPDHFSLLNWSTQLFSVSCPGWTPASWSKRADLPDRAKGMPVGCQITQV